MAAGISDLVVALRALGKAVEDSRADDAVLKDQFGWNFPDLNRHDLAKLAKRLADRLDEIPGSELNTKYSVERVIAKVAYAQANIVPQFWSGNGNQAYPLYVGLLEWIDDEFRALYRVRTDWETLASGGLLPKQLAGKLRSLDVSVKKLVSDRDQLREKVAYIEQAHEAALALPTDLEGLRRRGRIG